MGEIKKIRATRVAASVITEIIVKQEPVIFYTGKAEVARCYVLPLAEWTEAIGEVYYESIDPIRIDRSGVTEAAILEIIVGQVDAEWRPWRYGVLTQGGQPVAFIVPANEPWRGRVEGVV